MVNAPVRTAEMNEHKETCSKHLKSFELFIDIIENKNWLNIWLNLYGRHDVQLSSNKHRTVVMPNLGGYA